MAHYLQDAGRDGPGTEGTERALILTPKYLILVLAVVAVAGAFVISQSLTGDRPGTRVVKGTQITQTIGKVQTNAVVRAEIRLLEGDDAAAKADLIFQTIAGLPGIGKATLDTEALTLGVAYDSAQIDGAQIRETLIIAGYTGILPEDTVALEYDAEAGVQRITIAADQGGFDPPFLLARAGIPIIITYGPGTDCRTSVTFPELSVTADIRDGATVELGPVEAGLYSIICSGGGFEGGLVVQ